LQNLQNLFLTWKVARHSELDSERLLSNGKRLRAATRFSLDFIIVLYVLYVL
jgi:hypothetical protein